MLGNFISTQAMILRLAELQDRGSMYDEHASLAKCFADSSLRGKPAMPFEKHFHQQRAESSADPIGSTAIRGRYNVARGDDVRPYLGGWRQYPR